MFGTRRNVATVQNWFREFAGRGVPAPIARARVSAALILLDLNKWTCELDLEDHLMSDGRFYAFHDERLRRALRPFGWDVGVLRARRVGDDGVEDALSALLAALRERELDLEPAQRRFLLLEQMQRDLLDQTRRRFCRQRLRINLGSSDATQFLLTDLLQLASSQGKVGPVARHLVGAALELRFSELVDSQAAPDVGRAAEFYSGDFTVGDTVFHVITVPKPGHFDRARDNLFSALRPELLVPQDRVAGVVDQAEDVAPGLITVRAIEEFVSQNIETYGMFDRETISVELRKVITTYNERVMRLERDRSLTIDISTRR